MKNKLLYMLIIIVLTITGVVYYVLNSNNATSYQCATHIYSSLILPDDKEVFYKLDLKINKFTGNSGELKMTGTITTDTDNTSSINRIVYFSIIDGSDGNITPYVNDIRKFKSDNISDELFERYFKSFNKNSLMYVKIDKITPKRYIYSSSFGPYFICESNNNDSFFW